VRAKKCATDLGQPSLRAQGQRTPGLLFVVTGTLQVGSKNVGPGGHACMESIVQLVNHFGAGDTESPQAVASHDVVCLAPSTCLLLSIADLSGNLPMMRTLAQAVVAAEDDSDEEQSPPGASGPVAGKQKMKRGASREDLEAHRDELLRKLEAAQLQAKIAELEKQLNSMGPRPGSGSPARVELEKHLNSMGSRPGSGSVGSPLSRDGFELPSPLGAVAALKTGVKAFPEVPGLGRSHSDTEVFKLAFGHVAKAQESRLLAAVSPEAASPIPRTDADSPLEKNRDVSFQARHTPMDSTNVIPLPRPREAERDSRRYDPEYLQMLERHRTKWGVVWETSHYFNHQAYRRNMPKAGIPVDTTGDGKADSLAVDITGDGKVDLILSDVHSQRLALASLKRATSLDNLVL